MEGQINRLLALEGAAVLALMISACVGTAEQIGTQAADNAGAAESQSTEGERATAELPAGGDIQTTVTLIAAIETVETEEPMVEEVQATPWTPGGAAEVLQGDPRFTRFVSVLSQGQILHIIADTGPFTVFAPIDEAWADVAEEDLAALGADPVNTSDFLLSTIVEGQMSAADLLSAGTVATVNGQEITVSGTEDHLVLNGTIHVLEQIEATNGTIYAIDGLIYAPSG